MDADDPTPVPLPPREELARKRQLLLRIAADSTALHLTHQPGDDGWQPLDTGVQLKVLHEADDGALSYLLRLAPGAALPPHRHPVDEECVVLEGEVQIGALRVAAGGYHLGRKGVLHDALRSDHGALLFLRGAAPGVEHLI
jgi:anti-sigma factor ChrR (cupin superfamily)